MAWILYSIGGWTFYGADWIASFSLIDIPSEEVGAYGMLIFMAGMLFHWKFWIPFIVGFLAVFHLTRD